jgi:hypothetical protein
VIIPAVRARRRDVVVLAGPRAAGLLGAPAVWAVVTAAGVVGCASCAALALRRARIGIRRLAGTAAVAACAALGVAVEAGACLVCVTRLLGPRGGLDPRDMVLSLAPVAVLLLAAVIATVSAWRGGARRARGPDGA